MNIIFNPPDNEENQYIHLLVTPLVQAGFKVSPLDDFFSSRQHLLAIRLVHLNWFENVDDSSLFIALKSFFRKLVVLTAIKITQKPLVWTMHNRNSHENRLSFFSRALTYLLMRTSNQIIIHSHASLPLLAQHHPKIALKAVYLPHPNFIGVYGAVLPEKTNITPPVLHLLFIGAIKPYKNMELLIQIAKKYPEKLRLTIAGKPATETYKKQLEALLANTDNIRTHLRFIHDSELPSLLQDADALVLPYDIKSSLNSGTAILGFSYKRTVICPNIGTITDLQEAQEYVLSYTYETPEQHAFQLEAKIQEAIHLKANYTDIFREWGNKMFHYVKEKHANDKIGTKLLAVYSTLLKQD